MNLMLTAAGYPWTVIPVERRGTDMAALEAGERGSGHRAVHRFPLAGWSQGQGGTIHEKCYFM